MRNLTLMNQQATRAWLRWLRLAGLCAWFACSQLMAAGTCPQKAPAWGDKDQLRLSHTALLDLGWDSRCRLYLASHDRKLMRFDASGQPSKDFGTQGVVNLASWAFQMIVDDAHNRILWLYYSHGSGSLKIEIHALTMDGQPKLDFGRSGVAKMVAKRERDAGMGTSGRARMLVQADGSLLVAAQVESVQVARSRVWLFKVSEPGIVVSGSEASLLHVKTSNNRKIHLSLAGNPGGSTNNNAGAWFFSPDEPGAILVRLNEKGQPDTRFAQGGVLKLEQTTDAAALLPDRDGVIIAGSWHNARATLERYQANGSIDKNFGDAGKIDLKSSAIRKDALTTAAVGGSDFISVLAMEGGKSLSLQSWRRDGQLDTNWGKNGDWLLEGAEMHHVSLLRDPLGRLFLAQSHDNFSRRNESTTTITRIKEPPPMAAAPRRANPASASAATASAFASAPAVTPNPPAPSRSARTRPAKVEDISPPGASAGASVAAPVRSNPNEIWKYIDERGVPNFVNSQSQVPEQFKKSAVRMGR